MTGSNGNGHDRHDTPAYALRSELTALRTYTKGEVEKAREDASRAHDHAFRANARAEWLENLINGLEERIAARVNAQLELHLSPLAHEMAELRAGVFAAVETAKGAEKTAMDADRDAKVAKREAEMASDAGEVTGRFATIAADREQLELERRRKEVARAEAEAEEARSERERRRAAFWAAARKAAFWLTMGGGSGLLAAAFAKSCGG